MAWLPFQSDYNMGCRRAIDRSSLSTVMDLGIPYIQRAPPSLSVSLFSVYRSSAVLMFQAIMSSTSLKSPCIKPFDYGVYTVAYASHNPITMNPLQTRRPGSTGTHVTFLDGLALADWLKLKSREVKLSLLPVRECCCCRASKPGGCHVSGCIVISMTNR